VLENTHREGLDRKSQMWLRPFDEGAEGGIVGSIVSPDPRSYFPSPLWEKVARTKSVPDGVTGIDSPGPLTTVRIPLRSFAPPSPTRGEEKAASRPVGIEPLFKALPGNPAINHSCSVRGFCAMRVIRCGYRVSNMKAMGARQLDRLNSQIAGVIEGLAIRPFGSIMLCRLMPQV